MKASEKSPLISVITATYNRAHLLPRAINSVLSQSFQDFELIIVNNASSDNTDEVVQSFTDPRIVYKKNIHNKPLEAKNIGLDAARGDYVVFLDDDDELVPGALEIISHEFARLAPQEIKIIWLDCIDAESGNYSGLGPRNEGPVPFEDILCGTITGDYQMVLHKDAIGANRFDPDGWAGLLASLWIKLYRTNTVYHVPKTVLKAYRQHGIGRISNPAASLTKFMPNIIKSYTDFLQEYGKELLQYCPSTYSTNQGLLGFYQILHGQAPEGRKNIVASLKRKFSLKYSLLWAASFIVRGPQLRQVYLRFFV